MSPLCLSWLTAPGLLLLTNYLPRAAMGSRESPSRSQQPASPITWTILDLQGSKERVGDHCLPTPCLSGDRNRCEATRG